MSRRNKNTAKGPRPTKYPTKEKQLELSIRTYRSKNNNLKRMNAEMRKELKELRQMSEVYKNTLQNNKDLRALLSLETLRYRCALVGTSTAYKEGEE